MRWPCRPSTATATVVLSPSPASDESLVELGIARSGIGRWDRGVDTRPLRPALAGADACPGEVNVLYVGRQTKEKGADLLADAFLRPDEARPAAAPRARRRRPGAGAPRASGSATRATFLGWLEGDELARAYASADVFLFPSRTDTFGQVILEAGQRPAGRGGRRGRTALIADGVTGLLCPPDAGSLASAVELLASSPEIRRRIATAAVEAVAVRSWGRSLGQLADGYRRALDTLS